MKKLIITFLLCGWAINLHALPPFFSYGGGGTVSGEVNVSNDAYNATTWDNDGLNAPSRNAVRDKFESLDGDYQPLDTDLTIYAGITPSVNVQTVLGCSTYADILTALGLVIGTNVLAPDGDGSSLTGLTPEQVGAAASDHDHEGVYEPFDPSILKTTTTFGPFTGDIIPDNLTAAAIFQALETAIEGIEVGPGTDLLDSETGKLDLAYFPDLSTETLTVTELNITRKSGSATIAEFYEDPDNGDNKVTVTVPASMDSDTTFNLAEVYNSMTTLRDAVGTGTPGSGLPEGGTLNQIIVMTSEGAAWMDFEDQPAYTTLLNAFLAAGLNTFTFTPDTPASYPYYSATGTFNLDFEVTDTSTSYTIAGVRYQLDEDGYDGNSASDQSSNIWRVALTDLTEDTYTLQLEATDNKGTPNTGESSEYTVIVDTTDPVINLSAGANPTTHDGSGADTWDLQIGMIEELHTALIQYRLTVDGGETPEWSTWSPTWTTTGISLPDETEDLHIAVKVTDLAGNWDTGGITVPVSGGGGDYLVQEDFEGTGTPSGWGQWTDRPLPNFDYTSTVLEGTESMYLAGTGYHLDSAASTPTQLAGTDRHVAFMFRVPSLPSTDIVMLQLYNSTTLLGTIKLRTNGALLAQIAGGSEVYGTSGAISANTTYYVKVRWQAGEPATLTAWISSDGSSWTQNVSANNANQTSGVTYNTFRSNESNNFTPIIDLVREANEDINY